jgi:hypothetical protein
LGPSGLCGVVVRSISLIGTLADRGGHIIATAEADVLLMAGGSSTTSF